MIRLVLAEDQGMLRGALVTLLQLEDDLDVVGQASNGMEAWEMIRRLEPDCCILDIEMPGLSGLEVAETIQREQLGCKVIILTTFARPGYFQRAVAAGVQGYMLKDSPSDELVEALRAIQQGRRVFAPELSLALWEQRNPLTPREKEVLELAAEGLTMKAIGERLFLSHGTVRNYMSEIISKLQVETRIEAIHTARKNGWIT